MRWVRFEKDGEPRYGILENGDIQTVEGNPFDGYSETDERVAFDDARLLIPVVPKVFYACGLNYLGHVTEQAKLHKREIKAPAKPDVGYRANNALLPHGEAIVIPEDATDHVEYEAEIVVVIGQKARNLTPENALSCVLGYTIGNDVSERSWQKEDGTLWRAKNTDTFAPMGPWIETDARLDDMETIVSLNGAEQIRFKTNNMLFSIETYLSAITKYIALQPGDIVWMGTEGHSPKIAHGDVVDIEITGIGTLSNPVIRQGQPA